MSENENPTPRSFEFGQAAVNVSKTPAEEGAEKLKKFITGEDSARDPKDMTKDEKRAYRKMVKDLYKHKQITKEERKAMLAALK